MKKYKVTIKLKSGMLIGSGNDSFDLGGVDKSTIVDSTGKPYIPGSSLKGKLRFLAGDDCEFVNKYFGKDTISENTDKEGKNSIEKIKNQLLFSDLKLKIEEKNHYNDYFEIKTENRIDADFIANPRTNKRTIPNLTFEGIICAFNDLPESDFNKLENLFELLENYYIGGQGSRGYGWIEKAEIK